MTTYKNSTRFDGYHNIHKALRAVMTDTLFAVGRMDATDDCEVTRVVQQCRTLIGLCRMHLEKEERFIHPAMEARAPGSSAASAADHEHHAQQIEHVARDVNDLEAAEGDARHAAGALLYRSLGRFVGENFVHMNDEETKNNAILWRWYTDAELLAIESALVNSISPEAKGAAMPWLIKGLNPGERAEFLATVRGTVPEQVFAGMLASIKTLLSDLDWRKLSHELSRVAVAA
ncbi:MAG TPA: hemerythrin domain-containing protein [Candidatus Cybelea sp.]|nr:hemerythrin domain-containing protein [Candidatus Cybelea sp.]